MSGYAALLPDTRARAAMSACRRLFAAIPLTVSYAAMAGVVDCSQMLVETPGSVEARVCFARELKALESEMAKVARNISQKAAKKKTAFSAVQFQESQRKWRAHVSATCWLDAAGAGNVNAVFDHCRSQYTFQRLSQLKNLSAGISGEAIIWPMSNLEAVK